MPFPRRGPLNLPPIHHPSSQTSATLCGRSRPAPRWRSSTSTRGCGCSMVSTLSRRSTPSGPPIRTTVAAARSASGARATLSVRRLSHAVTVLWMPRGRTDLAPLCSLTCSGCTVRRPQPQRRHGGGTHPRCQWCVSQPSILTAGDLPSLRASSLHHGDWLAGWPRPQQFVHRSNDDWCSIGLQTPNC